MPNLTLLTDMATAILILGFIAGLFTEGVKRVLRSRQGWHKTPVYEGIKLCTPIVVGALLALPSQIWALVGLGQLTTGSRAWAGVVAGVVSELAFTLMKPIVRKWIAERFGGRQK